MATKAEPCTIENLREAFNAVLRETETGERLKQASLEGSLGEWTRLLTGVCVDACARAGLRASAKGHRAALLPESRSEYLGMDVMAFPPGATRWIFPAVVMELENSPRPDKIAYSLWKLLCVRADCRLLFCYRKDRDTVPDLIRQLKTEVVGAMGLQGRLAVEGRTIIVVGSRNEAATFPFGFFHWRELNTRTGHFETL